MALPKKVQIQLDQANSVLEALNAPPPEAQVPPTELVAAPVTETIVTAAEVAAPTPAPAQDFLYKDLEKRYQSLQGMHKSYETRISQMERTNADLAEQLRTSKQAQQAAPTTTAVDAKDLDVYGSDMVAMIKRVAETMFGSAAQMLDSRMTAIEQNLKGTTKAVNQTAEEMFMGRLQAAVPDYETINTSDGFLTWLAEVDDVYGTDRQSALSAAASVLDASRVAKVFQAYKATQTAPAGAPAPRKSVSELERQIVPSSVANQAPQQRVAPIITSANVQAFYRDMTQGKYRGREQEAARLEADINNALAEGRILDREPRYAT